MSNPSHFMIFGTLCIMSNRSHFMIFGTLCIMSNPSHFMILGHSVSCQIALIL